MECLFDLHKRPARVAILVSVVKAIGRILAVIHDGTCFPWITATLPFASGKAMSGMSDCAMPNELSTVRKRRVRS